MRKIYLGFATIIFLFSISFVCSVPAQAQPTKNQVQRARKLAGEGDNFFRQKNYKLAIDRYQKASLLVPNYPAIYYFKGYAHYNLQEYDLAIEALTKAREQGYSAIEVYKVRWYLYYLTKDFDNALKDAEEVVKVEPNNSNLLIAMGDIYRDKNMNKEAIDAYERAALLVPNNGDLQYFIAFTHAKLGDTTQQGVSALKAVQKGTRYLGDSWFLVGFAFQSEKKFAEAADAYERAISAKPELVASYSNLSQIYQSLNRYNDAITMVKKGIEFSPRDGNLYITLTWLLSLTDRHVEAIGAGKKAVELAPDQYMGFTNLCRAYSDIKEYDLAIQACNTALKLKPNDGETNYYIGRIFFLQKKPDVAATYYKKAVTGLITFTKENPDYADGYYLLGNAYLANSQVSNAILAYKKCLELNPNFAKVLYNLGYSYILNNDKVSAKEQYDLLLKLDKNSAAQLLQLIQAK